MFQIQYEIKLNNNLADILAQLLNVIRELDDELHDKIMLGIEGELFSHSLLLFITFKEKE